MPLPKQPLSSVNRQPQGVPVGGQFAATTHAEPNVTLSSEKGFFTEADNDPDIFANAPTTDGGAGDDPAHDLLAGGGNGSLPPLPPSNGGSGSSDGGEREANIRLMTDAAKKHAAKLINSHAKTINISARDNNGTVRFDDVLGPTGESIDDENGSLAQSLTVDLNASRPGGRGIPAEQILGTRKSASIDLAALFSGDIKVVGPGKPPRY